MKKFSILCQDGIDIFCQNSLVVSKIMIKFVASF